MGEPHQFAWGVATSAFQIEGGRSEDGKGDSIWDRFSDAGRLADPGDLACDHYHRWPADLDLMAELGVSAYRFSIAWTRVIPDGDGDVNPAGLDFYDRLVDGMVERGIAPWITLYHWDLPASLQDKGGWTSRSTATAFARYAEVVADRLGDRVDRWITHNEPWVATHLGHVDGVFAPGRTSWTEGLVAGHHILLSHGLATQSIRSVLANPSIGIAIDCRPARPASDDPADRAAQRHFDGYRNRWFFDPVFGKGYPEDIVEAYGERGRMTEEVHIALRADDLDTIAAPIDFLGLNYYTSIPISAGADETEDTGVPPGPNPPPGYTEMGWPITERALTGFLVRLHETYSPRSIVITENGASYGDGPDADGLVDDQRRIAYLDRHIDAALAARAVGVPVDGYFQWSFMDNLEWTSGFSQRFGIVHVDHETQVRTPKASFSWYRDRIALGI